MKLSNLFFAAAISVLPLCANADSDEFYYYNPVVSQSLPDPTVMRADDGYFYLFATEDIHNVPIYRSADLVTWTYLRTAFTDSTRPTFVSGGGIWAPDINCINGQYVLYYSMSTWGGEWACGIGVATSKRINGSYQDEGKLFISSEINVQNSIDPFYYEEEDGSKYLFWGSFHGIYGIELSDDGLSLKDGAVKKQISGSLTEGTCIYKHDGYYYLIGSAGSCCDGANSTYHLVVARSENLLGPYTDKDGQSAIRNNLSVMLDKSGSTIGPGHCSEVVEDDAGQTWILYHGYKADDVDAGRCLFLDQIQWDSEGWPYITGERTSVAWSKPVLSEQTFTYSYVDYIEFTGESENYRYMFDTGYVPNENTRVELQCRSYSENEGGEEAAGEWRAIFSGRSSNADGYSLYVNPNGTEWGYFAGGYINDNIAPHAYDTDYTISADLSALTINGGIYNTGQTSYSGTTQRLTLFSGLQDYPYYGRIYSLQIYEGNELMHDYKPCLRNEDEMVVLYDTVTGAYISPSDPFAFSYGSVVDAVQDVPANKGGGALATYNLYGQEVNGSFRGVVIQDGKKTIKQ